MSSGEVLRVSLAVHARDTQARSCSMIQWRVLTLSPTFLSSFVPPTTSTSRSVSFSHCMCKMTLCWAHHIAWQRFAHRSLTPFFARTLPP